MPNSLAPTLLAHARSALIGTTALAAFAVSMPAAAQPSTNATTNLIQLLIQNKVISKEAGEALVRQAEAEAAQARAELAAKAPPTPPVATASGRPASTATGFDPRPVHSGIAARADHRRDQGRRAGAGRFRRLGAPQPAPRLGEERQDLR